MEIVNEIAQWLAIVGIWLYLAFVDRCLLQTSERLFDALQTIGAMKRRIERLER